MEILVVSYKHLKQFKNRFINGWITEFTSKELIIRFKIFRKRIYLFTNFIKYNGKKKFEGSQ